MSHVSDVPDRCQRPVELVRGGNSRAGDGGGAMYAHAAQIARPGAFPASSMTRTRTRGDFAPARMRAGKIPHGD